MHALCFCLNILYGLGLIKHSIEFMLDDDSTGIFHESKMRIGINEFDHRILALPKQQRERPERRTMISVTPVQCSTTWTIKPTESRSLCGSIIGSYNLPLICTWFHWLLYVTWCKNRSTGITQYLPFASIFVPFPKSHQKNFLIFLRWDGHAFFFLFKFRRLRWKSTN